MTQKSGLDVLISAFVHYPELSSVKYEAAKDQLKIEVALNGPVDEVFIKGFVNKTCDCLRLYHELSYIKPDLWELTYTTQAGITLLRLYRDFKSVTEGEVELFVLLLREYFVSLLVRDENSDVLAEESYAREIRKSLVHKTKQGDILSKNFFAYRDEGTMFVFNK